MARIRTIKPEFWTNEKLSMEHIEVHMAAAALLNYADDDGYFNAHPKLFMAACFPIREIFLSPPEILRRLQTIGYIRLGSDQEGKRIGQVLKFAEHQKISHKTPTKYSDESITWDDSGISPENLRSPPETFRPEGKGKEQGTGNREQGIPVTDVTGRAKPVEKKTRGGNDPDPVKEEIWATGRRLLEGVGMNREKAGTFLGKLCKDFGNIRVLDVVRDAAKTTPADPGPWMIAACQDRAKPKRASPHHGFPEVGSGAYGKSSPLPPEFEGVDLSEGMAF